MQYCERGLALAFEILDEVLNGSYEAIQVVRCVDNLAGRLDLGFEGFQEFWGFKLEPIFIGLPDENFFGVLGDDPDFLKLWTIAGTETEALVVSIEKFLCDAEDLVWGLSLIYVVGRSRSCSEVGHVFREG